MHRSPNFSLARATIVLAIAALPLVLAGPASSADQNAAPVASFTFAPPAPVTGENVTFTSTSTDVDGHVAIQAWDLDNDGSYDDGTATTATRTFATAGTYTVHLAAVDDDYAYHTTSKIVVVKANTAPSAVFSAGPADPVTGQAITLTSSSADPDGRAVVEDWDLDNDGAYDDRKGRTATVSFADNGVRRVSLRVTDSAGATKTALRDITVRNRAPVASFGYAPTAPVAGSELVLTSTAGDPDGTVTGYSWDLDGDGALDDGTGATIHTTFASAGSHMVALQVRDDDGMASASFFRTVEVTAKAVPPVKVPDVPATGLISGATVQVPTAALSRSLVTPQLMDPFPRVRIRGVTTAAGARLSLLGVRISGGYRILVRCKGRGCPWAWWAKSARTSSTEMQLVRVPGFKRHPLRSGAVVEVFVTRGGAIGKYMRLRVRRGLEPPKRVDGCTAAGVTRAGTCPR